ncbi:MAG: hypothetical protein M3Z54_04340 [Gemmatimonadota bacterium]|nr:hypothetical protein [Gemmatimonadota bacterium]
MRAVVINEGARAGAVLALCAALLAYIGLAPGFAWVPEVPLVLGTVLVPLIAFAIAGARAARVSRTWVAGAYAGAICGAIGGVAGGLAYVYFGKSLLNIPVGLLVGIVAGAGVGSASASFVLRRVQ